MCGICGLVDLAGRGRATLEKARKMAGLLVHRGPDQEGYHVARDHNVAFGHRRLSIIDTQTGSQPMKRDSCLIIYNGEIYNFMQLRKELISTGTRFTTSSDTEVLMVGLDREGPSFLKKLNGMFAFAFLSRDGSILLARDRFGKKPLYYTIIDGLFIFSSELEALLSVLEKKPEIEKLSLAHYLMYGYTPDHSTIYRGIHQLPKGHFMKLTPANPASLSPPQKYYELIPRVNRKFNFPEYSSRLKTLLTDAVRIRMISDVPLGAFLSGGLDSSLVVSIMSHYSGLPVETFSVGFEEEEYSELERAAKVAAIFDCRHREKIVPLKRFDLVPSLVRRFGEPFADPSFLPVYLVSKAARESVTVALSGDGADELFGGYERYIWNKAATIFNCLVPSRVSGILEKLFRKIQGLPSQKVRQILGRARKFLSFASRKPLERYRAFVSYFDSPSMNHLFRDFASFEREVLLASDLYDSSIRIHKFENLMTAILFADFDLYLTNDILVKMDRMSMAASLETRAPFLDYRIVELAMEIPVEQRIKGFTLKYFLKSFASEFLPDYIIKLPKHGFALPISPWLKGSLKTVLGALLTSKNSLSAELFRKETIHRLISEHMSGFQDHAFKLWNLMILEIWNREMYCGKEDSIETFFTGQ